MQNVISEENEANRYDYLCSMKNNGLNFSEFSKAKSRSWEEVAIKQLEGDTIQSRLNWISESGLASKSYYNEKDLKDLDYLHHYSSKIRKHQWKLYEHIEESDTIQANAHALDALSLGCEGVLFSLDQDSNLKSLTKGIFFEHYEVSFFQNKFSADRIGSFQLDHDVSGFIIATKGQYLGWHSDRFSQQSSLANLTEMVLDFARNSKRSPVIFLRVSSDFFNELVRVRAIRYLFWRIATVAGLELDPNEILIHCEVGAPNETSENLFELTTKSLSAVLGGANSISFDPKSSNNRINRNIGNLIRDEAKIHAFEDSGSGSFFIDSLTDQVIKRVWGKLQEVGL